MATPITDDEIANWEGPRADSVCYCHHPDRLLRDCASCVESLLASAIARIRADAAKIARLEAEREDRREDKREMRDEIAKLRAVVEAARELTSWDWRVEVVRADLDRVEDALAALDERYGTSPWGTPAWLDAPDGPGWHWMRDPDGQLYIVHLYASADGLRTIHGSDPVYMRRQWQRVAPPREG